MTADATADNQHTLQALLERPDVIERLQRAFHDIFQDTLCLRCLGRALSRIDRTASANDKGQAVAAAAGVTPVAAGDCRWCEGLFEDIDRYVALITDAFRPYGYDSFLIGSRIHPAINEKEAKMMAALGDVSEHFEPLKTELNREIGAVLAPRLGKRVDFQKPDVLATLDPHFGNVLVTPSSVYVYARYRKYDRELPQTKWPCRTCRGTGCPRCSGTGKQYETSVEELLAAAAVEAFGAKDESFHGSGREDIDALMLGSGRPFVLELKEPKVRTPRDPPTGTTASSEHAEITFEELERRINAHARPHAEIEALRLSDKDEVVHLKEAAFDKAYRAHVVSDTPVPRSVLDDAIAKLTTVPIEQRTPERVSHRRADMVRKRRIKTIAVATFGHHARAEHEGVAEDAPPEMAGTDAATRFTLDILAESGTYIKELVHGDEGRTQPNLTALVRIPMKVAYLDVVGVGSSP